MACDWLAIDDVLCNAVLIDALSCDDGQRARVDLLAPVRDDDHDDLLPRVWPPHLGSIARAQVLNVLLDAIHGSRVYEETALISFGCRVCAHLARLT